MRAARSSAGASRTSRISEDLPSGASGYNFALLQHSSLAGVVYCDEDFNGVINPNDPGSRGDGPAAGTNDLEQPISQTVTTDANGVRFHRPATGHLQHQHRDACGLLAVRDERRQPGRHGRDQSGLEHLLFCEEGTAYDFGLVLSAAASAASSTRTATTAAPGRPTRRPGVTITLVGTDITGAR